MIRRLQNLDLVEVARRLAPPTELRASDDFCHTRPALLRHSAHAGVDYGREGRDIQELILSSEGLAFV